MRRGVFQRVEPFGMVPRLAPATASSPGFTCAPRWRTAGALAIATEGHPYQPIEAGFRGGSWLWGDVWRGGGGGTASESSAQAGKIIPQLKLVQWCGKI